MEDFPGSAELKKNLIKLDDDLPKFKNNSKAIEALQEFISNPLINKVCLNCEKSLLLRAFVEFIKKSAKFAFTQLDALKIKNIEDSLRKSIVLLIKSSRDVYEGEIIDIRHVRDENNIVQYIEMSLKTLKSTKKINLSKNLIELVNDVNVGDVVYIEPNIGLIKRIGRSETRINEYDLEGDKHVQLSKGSVHSTREKDIYLTLYDFDYAFNKYNDDISDFSRRHVDSIVLEYLQRGIAQFVCSGVYIENSKHLDILNIHRLVHVSDLYPHLKIFIDNANSEIFTKSFLYIDSVLDEKVIDILEYFSKNLSDVSLRSTVESVVNFENYETVLAILKLSNSPTEFKEMFN